MGPGLARITGVAKRVKSKAATAPDQMNCSPRMLYGNVFPPVRS